MLKQGEVFRWAKGKVKYDPEGCANYPFIAFKWSNNGGASAEFRGRTLEKAMLFLGIDLKEKPENYAIIEAKRDSERQARLFPSNG